MADKPIYVRGGSSRNLFALRVALFVLVPAALLFNYYVSTIALSRDIKSIVFVHPLGWSYHSETTAVPNMRRIDYTAQGIADAIARNHAVPLFLLSKYPSSEKRPNPLIGVNAYDLGADSPPAPEALLAANLARVQSDAGGKLEVVEQISTLPLATLPAARVVLRAPGKPLDRMTVYTMVAGHLSFTIVASDASSGEDDVSADLETFLANVAVD